MNDKPKTYKSKTLAIKSSLKTFNFNLKVDGVDYGFFRKHNVVKTTTLDSKIDLSLSYLTKTTCISIRMLKDEAVTIKWNRIRGRFEIVDNDNIIISEKTSLTKFSKIFYPFIAALVLIIVVILLFVFLK